MTGQRGGTGPLDLTPAQWECLSLYAEYGDQRAVAKAKGISHQTVKNHLTQVYDKLDVTSAIEAFTAVGWLIVTHKTRDNRRRTRRINVDRRVAAGDRRVTA